MTITQFVSKLFAMGEQDLAAGQDPVAAWYRSNRPGTMLGCLRTLGLVSAETADGVAHSWFKPLPGCSYDGWDDDSFAMKGAEVAAETAAAAFGADAAREALAACRRSEWLDRRQAIYDCDDHARFEADRDAHFAVMGAVRAAFSAYHQALQEQLLQVWKLTTPELLLAALATAA